MKFDIKKIFWIIFFISLIKAILFSHLGFGLLDEGESLHNATRISNGELPYEDFFAIFPPLDNYLFAFIFQIFGKSVIAPRIVMSIIFSFAPATIFLILSKYVKKYIAIFPAILLIFLDLNVERLYFLTPIFAAVLIINRYPFISGSLLGFASLIRADLPGTYLIGLGIVLLISKKLRELVKLGLGYMIPIGLMVLWLYSKNILGLFLEFAIKRSVIITKLHDLPISTVDFSSIPRSYEAFVLYLILGIYLLFLIKNIWKKKNIFIGFFISGVLALPYVFGRTDMGHIIKGGIPALFLSAYFLDKLKSNQLKFIFYSIIFIIFVANIFQHFWWIRFNNVSINIGGYDLRINSSYVSNSTVVSAETMKNSVEFLKETQDTEKVLALPYLAGIYFLADRQPPVEFNNLLNGFVISVEEENEFIKKIEAADVKRIVYTPETGPKMKNRLLKEYNPIIHKFIMDNFMVKKQTPEGWLLMERND